MLLKTNNPSDSKAEEESPSRGQPIITLSPKQQEELKKRQKLLALYDRYKQVYLKYYVTILEKENEALREAFPGVEFTIMSRVKSKHNYTDKLSRKGRVQDIFGDKIIILSADGKTDEETLTSVAYQIEEFLTTYNPNITELPERRKDYIAHPKANGYSSLHLTRVVRIPEERFAFYRETQIKTFRMRETEKTGSAGHSTVYKSNRHYFLNRIVNPESAEYFLPLYMHFEFDKQSRSEKLVPDSFENRFRYYFGQDYESFLKQRGIIVEDQSVTYSFEDR